MYRQHGVLERPFHVLGWRQRRGNFLIDENGRENEVRLIEKLVHYPSSVYTYWEHGIFSHICWVIIETTWKVGIRNGEFRSVVCTPDDIREFENLVIQYVSPFLIKDLCVLVASFM